MPENFGEESPRTTLCTSLFSPWPKFLENSTKKKAFSSLWKTGNRFVYTRQGEAFSSYLEEEDPFPRKGRIAPGLDGAPAGSGAVAPAGPVYKCSCSRSQLEVFCSAFVCLFFAVSFDGRDWTCWTGARSAAVTTPASRDVLLTSLNLDRLLPAHAQKSGHEADATAWERCIRT